MRVDSPCTILIYRWCRLVSEAKLIIVLADPAVILEKVLEDKVGAVSVDLQRIPFFKYRDIVRGGWGAKGGICSSYYSDDADSFARSMVGALGDGELIDRFLRRFEGVHFIVATETEGIDIKEYQYEARVFVEKYRVSDGCGVVSIPEPDDSNSQLDWDHDEII